MQVLRGSKREITIAQWNEVLAKAEKSLAESEKLYEIYGDEDSKQWVEEDKAKVEEIKEKIKSVVAFMDEHNIQ